MPPAVHKVLAHGAQIMMTSVLPVGILGEDAAESRNKLYKSDRLHHARKTSRVDTLTDVMNRALDTSDIIISTISLKKRMDNRNRKPLPPEVLSILSCPDYEEVMEAELEENEDVENQSSEIDLIFSNLEHVNIELEDENLED